jgi:NAD(P)-dependent dehydrogenase (short-subunit alcohol dehydrogenase family)
MENLHDKVVIVTGGTRGIGRAIAERLLREGSQVAICGRSQESVDRALGELRPLGRVIGEAADLADYAQVVKFFQSVDRAFGRLDILVNNAGAGVFKKVGEMSPEEWHANIDLNLSGAFYCSREALSRFKKAGGGYIVNISSLAGKNAFTRGAGYNASKFGLNGFSEALMLDHRYDNVRVTTVMPGSVDTHFPLVSGGPRAESDTSWMMAPEDVAEVVAMVLRMPSRTMVSSIEMRPSRPVK